MSGSSKDKSIGYKNPPRSTQFQKGQSGNPNGRPKGRKTSMPYDTVLGQMVTIREDGEERKVTATVAFLLQLVKQGLAGDGSAARASLRAIEEARSQRLTIDAEDKITSITHLIVGFGANSALESLRMARKLERYRPKARMKLEPWIVEAALARSKSPLTVDQQRTILDATRTPGKVKWPDWWSVFEE